jgi:hypothetical protein
MKELHSHSLKESFDETGMLAIPKKKKEDE